MKGKKRGPNSADIQVGESIRAHRLIANMSQSELANRLGVSFQQVQKYEKGVNRVGAGRLPLIAGIFGVPVGALFDANADAGELGRALPVNLVPDKSALSLLHSFAGVTNRPVRHCLIDLVDAIAKAEKQRQGEHK